VRTVEVIDGEAYSVMEAPKSGLTQRMLHRRVSLCIDSNATISLLKNQYWGILLYTHRTGTRLLVSGKWMQSDKEMDSHDIGIYGNQTADRLAQGADDRIDRNSQIYEQQLFT
jgi:hypothetical protein